MSRFFLISSAAFCHRLVIFSLIGGIKVAKSLPTFPPAPLDEFLRLLHHEKLQSKIYAGLAELVDALDSGSSVRKDFGVQVPGSALS
jgi:hypothetical protein